MSEMKKTVFNDKEKKARTRGQVAEYFAVDDRPVLVRLKEWLGTEEMPANKQKPAVYSPWERMQEEKNQ